MEFKFGMAALIGPPNAGKSTLLNQVLGQKLAIVTPKPQTTRNQITGIWSSDEAQVVFLDTPGVHRLKGRLNKFLLQAAWQALQTADVVTVILDTALYASKPYLFDKEIAPLIKPIAEAGQPIIVAANKVDKIRDKPKMLGVLQQIADTWPGIEIFPISARTGDGVDRLLDRILEHIPEGMPMFPEDQVSTVPLRFMASEIIREKVFMSLKQELPYQTTVEIEHWEEDEGFARIHALIYTARNSHKGIIIGKGGANLKRIGQQAREEIQELLDKKVHLEIWVKVREGWTEDVGFLRGLGFGGE